MLRITKFALTVMIIALGAIVVHELAHLAAARLLSIKIVTIDLFNPAYLSPAITIAKDTIPSKLPAFWYAGGLSAGGFLLIPLTIWRGWFRQNFNRWALGLSLATIGWLQIVQGVMEGALHAVYINGSGEVFSASHLFTMVWGSFGLLLYLALFPRPRS